MVKYNTMIHLQKSFMKILSHLLILFFYIHHTCFALDQTLCTPQRCKIIVDAGSSGSRVHVYAQNQSNKAWDELFSNKINPGFANIPNNDVAIDAYLNTLFAEVALWDGIPTYFYATAGMRLLEPQQQFIYYQKLTDWFNTKSHLILKEARTLSGQEEGVFAWLALNNRQAGVMDVGGASTQIVFPIREDASVAAEDKVQVVLNHQPLTLFVHSFLNLGLNQVIQRYHSTASCFPKGYLLSNQSLADGDALACSTELSMSFKDQFHIDTTVQDVLRQHQPQTWYSLGAINSVIQSPPFTTKKNAFNGQHFLKQAQVQICQQSWDALKTKYPNDDYLFNHCIAAAYFKALAIDGYGISPKQPIHIVPKESNMDWTRGVLVA